MSRRHAAIEEQAARWLARGEAADAAALNAWLEEDTAHRVAYLRLRRVWRESGALRRGMAAPERPPARPPRRWSGWAAAAALLAGGLLWQADVARESGAAPTAVLADATPVGGRSVMALADGSRVELGTNSRVRSRIGSAKRDVWLERGEAYFDVAHDASRPFVVHAGSRLITVLGTRFAVRLGETADDVRVTVAQGRVRVDSPQQPAAAVELLRGNALTAQARRVQIEQLPEAKLEQRLAWRRHLLVFDDTTLADAAAEFNRYHERPLVITDPAVAQVRIGGQFDAANLDGFVHLLQAGLRLQVLREPDRIRVSREVATAPG